MTLKTPEQIADEVWGLAEAWREGYQAGYENGYDGLYGRADNPYE